MIFENPIFAKKTYKQLYFFFSDLNLECFQLSFDVYIVYIDKKLWIFENCRAKLEIF